LDLPEGYRPKAFCWSEAYSVRIELMDQQHRAMLAAVAELNVAPATGDGDAILGPTFERLMEHARRHFADEEALMMRHDFPTLITHRAEHEHFRKKIEAFIEHHKRGKVGVASALLLFLQQSLKEHVMHTDQRYSAFLNARGIW
jgi:hemerythrin